MKRAALLAAAAAIGTGAVLMARAMSPAAALDHVGFMTGLGIIAAAAIAWRML